MMRANSKTGIRSRAATFACLALLAVLAVLPAPYRVRFATYGLTHTWIHIAVFYAAF
jgi:hypothetical protein